MNDIAQLRAQALRALGLDPFDAAALKKATGVDGNLAALRRAALTMKGIDPYDHAALRRLAATAPPAPPKKAARSGQSKPRAAAVKPTNKVHVPKLFTEFLASGCKNLRLAAKVLDVEPRPPLQRSVLRKAWIALIGAHHPDKGGNVLSAQAVNAAYQLLSKFSS